MTQEQRPANFIRPDRCEKCKFSMIDPANVGLFECRFNPPAAHAFPMQDRTNNSIAFQEYASFPKVRAESWCGQYRPTIQLSN